MIFVRFFVLFIFGFSRFVAQESDILVREADISAIIRVWSKRLGKNFILDERVKGKVSVYLPSELSPEDANKVLDAILHYKGFTTVPIGENLFKIVPLKEAKQSNIPTKFDQVDTSVKFITKVSKLTYVPAEEMSKLIQPLLGPDGFLTVLSNSNALIIIDTEQNILRLDEIIASLDVPAEDVELTLIPLMHSDAKDLAERLKEVLALGSQGSILGQLVEEVRAVEPRARAQPIADRDSPQIARRTLKEPKIVADERTNSLIVVADPATTLKIRAVVTQLDTPVNRSSRRFYFYKCRFAKAEDLANTLAGLVGAGGGGGQTASRQMQRDGDAREGSLLLGGRTGGRVGGRRLGESRIDQGARQAVSAKLSDDLSITADIASNSLVIYASRSEYEKVLALLRQLDVKKRQVLVEATILEVQLVDQVSLGLEFLGSVSGKEAGAFVQKGFSDLVSILQNPSKLSGFSAAVASMGTLKIGDDIVIPSQAALIKAAQASQIANVLSAPQILTLDNEQAEILVGQNVPFVVSQSIDRANLENRFNQIERQDVGIILRITPQVASNDLVNLKVFTEVSSVVPGTDGSSEFGPTTNVRTLETTIAAKNGQMIVIGGLISDDQSTSDSGVPFLKNVPFVGQLFKNSADSKLKRNLLLFITPRVINDQFDIREETVQRSSKLRAAIEDAPMVIDRDDVLRNPAMDDVLEFDKFIEPKYPVRGQEESSKKEQYMKNPSSDKSSLSKENNSQEATLRTKNNQEPLEKIGGVVFLQDGECEISLPFKLENKKFCISLNALPEKVLNLILQANFLDYTVESKVCSFSRLPEPAAKSCHQLTNFEILNFGKYPWTVR
jgi:general secretion pathway protein D